MSRPRNGYAATVRGEMSEARARAIVRAAVGGLPWVRAIRPASDAEDALGIDIVVETRDVGELYVQVKSSRRSVAKWRKRYRATPMYARAMVIVCTPGHPSTEPLTVHAELARLRAAAGAPPRAPTAAPDPFVAEARAWLEEYRTSPAGRLLKW